jgi:hypothetical protein
MSWTGILCALLLALAFAVVWNLSRWAVRKDRDVRQAWRAFAAAKGLREQKPEYPYTLVFKGRNRGFPFVLERLRRRRGNSQETFTRMTLTLTGLPAGLRIYRETAPGKAPGPRGIETGDSGFDKTFVIRGKNAEDVRGYLTPERRHAVRTYMKELEWVRLLDDGLHWERIGQVTSMRELDRLHTGMGEFAAVLSHS